MLTLTEQVLFALAAIFSAYGTWLGFASLFNVIGRGAGPALRLHWHRVGSALWTWITMRPLWRARRLTSLIHAGLAWGFVFYLAVNAVDLAKGYWAGPWLELPVELVRAFRLAADLFSVIVLMAMLWFLVRRFVLPARTQLQARPEIRRISAAKVGLLRLTPGRDSLLVGLFIVGHVGFRLLGESFGLAYTSDPWQPAANAISPLWADLSPAKVEFWEHVSWWMALGLILVFVPWFPYTKHVHLIMAAVNFATKPDRTSPGALEPLNFEDEEVEVFGAIDIEDLSRTSLTDAFACIMCNRCQEVCPAYATGKDLSPAALEINKRYFLNEHMGAMAGGEPSGASLLDYAITESAVWACTACGACTDICPVGNEPMLDILDLRRGMVLMEDRYPSEFEGMFRGLERQGNPWNLSSADRLRWADGLNIPTLSDNPDADLLWWVGCAPAHDQRAQQVARALAGILSAAGVSFAVLGQQENCTGDAARRSGNEYLFDQLARKNIQTLDAVRPRKILTTCPHCLHTLGKEYPALGGRYEVVHHTQLLAELQAKGRIPGAHLLDGTVTFHDPCYLARQNGIVNAPREALGATGLTLSEMPRHGRKSFCCGAGGAQMWKEEEKPTVSEARYQEAAATGAATLAVGCPFCLTMLQDEASRASDTPMRVADVAELIADQLPD
ncbi:MAG: (Fe-S)-binding protein [Bacteroidota bacterium]|nr:(Fe-S)-binding protein [Bacteroidota bacterium]